MQFRLFQVLAVSVAVFFVLRTLYRLITKKSDVYSNVAYFVLWFLILLLAIFPDRVARKMANIFGFEDTTNAVIFVFIGIVVFLQFRMFNMIRRQEKSISALYRKVAILDHEKAEDEDTLRS